MPMLLEVPVLQVNSGVIHRIDTTDPKSLHSMWAVFARCADSVNQGRRLENLSWRLFSSQSVYHEAKETSSSAIPSPRDTIRDATNWMHISNGLPQLSNSVDSVADEEAIESALELARTGTQRQDSCASSHRRQITPDSVEKMVRFIVEAKALCNDPRPEITTSSSEHVEFAEKVEPGPHIPEILIAPELKPSSAATDASPHHSSECTSVSSLPQASPIDRASSQISQGHHVIVHGFEPSSPSTSSRILSNQEVALSRKAAQPVKAMFAQGGSSGDDSYSDHSSEDRKQPLPQIKRKMIQAVYLSEEESSLRSAMVSSLAKPNGPKNITSFHHQPVTETYKNTSAVDDDQSETENEDVDESAIDDDDDSSEWEDAMEESGKSSVKEFTFKRVDSSVNLTSRRSLITMMLVNNDQSQPRDSTVYQPPPHTPLRTPSNLQGRTVAPSSNDSDDAALMMMWANRPPMRSKNDIPRSSAQPIMTTTNAIHHQAALSPRTTRRNMLAAELTESLRRHLLWERSQKTSTANAVLKRCHTSHDVANLKQYPEQHCMKEDTEVNTSDFDSDRDLYPGYRGW